MRNSYILGSVMSKKYFSTIELRCIGLQISTTDKWKSTSDFLGVADSNTSFAWNIIWTTLLEIKHGSSAAYQSFHLGLAEIYAGKKNF